MELDGRPVGDPLSDKACSDFGHRWHDVFHLAYSACLGWSPTFRTLICRRRVSDPVVNEVEDGGAPRSSTSASPRWCSTMPAATASSTALPLSTTGC